MPRDGAAGTMNIRVLIADDHGLMREGLASLLRSTPQFSVVGVAANGREAVAIAGTVLPDIAILDVSMPDMNGIEATSHIIAVSPATRVLAVSMHDDRQFVSRMIEAGARGYLLKDCVCDELLRALETVMGDRLYFSAKLTGAVLDSMSGRRPAETEKPFLSARERETLQLIAEGHTSKEIAQKLAVGVKTVESFRKRLMDKLGVRSIAELTKTAVREGLTSV